MYLDTMKIHVKIMLNFTYNVLSLQRTMSGIKNGYSSIFLFINKASEICIKKYLKNHMWLKFN